MDTQIPNADSVKAGIQMQMNKTSPFLVFLLLALLLTLPSSAKAQNIAEVSYLPQEPILGEEVNVSVVLLNETNLTDIQLMWCTFYPTVVCRYEDMYSLGNNTFYGMLPTSKIEETEGNETTAGFKIIAMYDNQEIEYWPSEHTYENFTVFGESLPEKKPFQFTTEFLLSEGLLLALVISLLCYGMFSWKKARKFNRLALASILVLIILASLNAALFFAGTSPEVERAPDFTATDVDGNVFNLSDFRGKEVVVMDFMSISCTGCKHLAEELKDVHSHYNESEVEIISIDVSRLDTVSLLKDFKEKEGYGWRVAMDPGDLFHKYAVGSLPKLLIIDKEGFAVFEGGEIPATDIEKEIDSALRGKSEAIALQSAGIIVTAAVAGIATYFSPCSFPMLPGFITYYLTSVTERRRNTILTALVSGIVAGLGMIILYLVIGLITISLGTAVNVEENLAILGPVVGTILIFLGALMFTNIEYHRILKPFGELKARLFKKRDEGGFYSKLFAYGLGYGAAALACTFPVFLAVLLTATIGGSFLSGVLVLLVFSGVIFLLMTSITLLLSVLGREAVRKLSAYTDLIKKISGFVLVLVGLYLLYYYLSVSL